jgi:8-oxo-dGTP pyrophosphatase MutT (NUDIX family)
MSADAGDPPIRDASTVILLRETAEGPETFMLCRHQRSGFMGGAHVFPGGKVDAADQKPGWGKRFDVPAEELTTRLGETTAEAGLGLLVAAVRETFEEAGVLLAGGVEAADLAGARTRLLEGESFSTLADELDFTISANALTPYARWVTPKMESRRFDTRFYIAAVPPDQRASHDGSETTSAKWLRPADAIDEMYAGRIKLAPPTVRTLQWLARFDRVDDAVADAVSRKPPLVRPVLVSSNEGWFIALPGDPEHPESKPALSGATRMVLDGTAWRDA